MPKPRPAFTVDLSVMQLVLLAALFWTVAANRGFFAAALQGRTLAEPSAWGWALALFVAVTALHVLLVGLVAQRWTVKPVLAVLTVVAALASYFMGAYGVYMDPSMLRNVLRTHPGEAGELLHGSLALHLLLWAGLPLLLLWRVRIRPAAASTRAAGWLKPALGAAGWRLGLLGLSFAVLVGAVMAVFQPFASMMRNHKEVRYLITPANVVWSLGAVLAADARGAARPRQPIGLDVAPGPTWAARQRPLVLLLVVGETARSASWGLSGYARQTTPELARLQQQDPAALVNFARATACGTNTEISLPCMFAPIGRRDYDEERIRGQESLLHVAARAGVAVHWRDNQSGCKGVCDGLPHDRVTPALAGSACQGNDCLDEGLIADLDQRLLALKPAAGQTPGTQLWVLHMLGNHGPAYHRRVPAAFVRFEPACQSDDLRLCTQAEIVNAYDNALLYTDYLLAAAITRLRSHAQDVDSALIYVSDHGESLGEHGLFLHGMPYAIAPDVQKQVPWVTWVSPGLERAAGLQPGCLAPTLARQATQAVAHDHLFHTVLSLLGLRTALYAPAWDLLAPCRSGLAATAVVRAAGAH
jgi:lipid A ethanolaminephosphotransferase